MKTWIGIAVLAVFSVATTRIALHYLTYLETVLALAAVIVLILIANVFVNKWRARNERRLAAVILSLEASQQRAALDELSEDARKRILQFMAELAPRSGAGRF